MKQILRSAHDKLFARSPDERFRSLESLWDYAQRKKEDSVDRWHSPTQITPQVEGGDLVLSLGSDGAFLLNDWSFSQLCRLSERQGVTDQPVTYKHLCEEVRDSMFMI